MWGIQVCPVKELYEIALDADLEQCAAIAVSSYEVERERLAGLRDVLILQYDDVTDERRPTAFRVEMAAQIKAFVDSLPSDTDTVFVCCDGGVSRSAATAAAILRYQGRDEGQIRQDLRYHPNPLVYETLCQVFGLM